jgi:AraC-like DNA-binding protein
LYLTFLLSYIVFLLAPTTISSIVYFNAARIIEADSIKVHDAMLAQAQQTLDAYVEEMHSVALQLSFNPRVQSYVNWNDPVSLEDRYKESLVLRDLGLYRSTCDLLSDFFVHFSGTQSVMTPSAKFGADSFYRHMYRFEGVDSADSMNVLHTTVYSRHVSTPRVVSLREAHGEYIPYVQTIPVTGGARYVANAVFLLDAKRIEDVLSTLAGATGAGVYVVTEDRRVVAASGLAPKTASHLLEAALSESGFPIPFDEDPSLIVGSRRSDLAPWSYVVVIPKSQFLREVDRIRTTALWVIITCLVAGVLLAAILARRNYEPIQTIVQDLASRSGESADVYRDEYETIRSAVHRYVEQNVRYRQLADNLPVLRGEYLRRLLSGALSDERETRETLDFFGIGFGGPSFLVLRARVVESEVAMVEDRPHDAFAVRMVVQDVLSSALSEIGETYILESGALELVGIVNASRAAGAALERSLRAVSERSVETLESRFGVRLVLAFGDVVGAIAFMHESLRQAELALSYRYFGGTSSVILFHDVENREHEYWYPEDRAKRLSNSLRTGRYSAAEAVLTEVFTENFADRSLPFAMVRFLLFDILSTTVKALSELRQNPTLSLPAPERLVESLSMCETVDSAYDQLLAVFSTICSEVGSHKKSHNASLLDRIVRFIAENYADRNLGLPLIAERLGITPSYLSSFFKEQTGENLTAHIHSVRIAQAKAILECEDETLDVIADRVGYGSGVALIKAFKRYEGITPGQYKDNTTSRHEIR